MATMLNGMQTQSNPERQLPDPTAPAGAAGATITEIDALSAATREIEALRQEVADLRDLLSRPEIESHPEPLIDRPWLRIAGTAAATFVLGRLVQRLRLGAAGAAAVPLIVAQANGRIW